MTKIRLYAGMIIRIIAYVLNLPSAVLYDVANVIMGHKRIE